MSKKNVWLGQVNHTFGRGAYLPYSVGCLQAYAQTFPEIREEYEFQPLLYKREPIEDVMGRMEDAPPDVLGLSLYCWNANYSLALAKAVWERFHGCLVVLGGPHVPSREMNGFLDEHYYVDLLIHGEGEEAFAKLLKFGLERERLGACGITFSGWARTIKFIKPDRISDLDKLPSPYLTGIFDRAMGENKEWQPTQELVRGCPYLCSFCDWGSSVYTKVRKFPLERSIEEVEWFASHGIEYVMNADANFGMLERDVEFVEKVAEIKRRTGFPKKLRYTSAKNSGDRVFRISQILHREGMSKGVTLSFQSMDENTLTTIKRKNIGVEVFKGLMRKYREENMPTYSEIIIGLPGETYDSFANGLDELVSAGQHDGLNVYLCSILPNSEMNDPAYKEKHGIQSVVCPDILFHNTPSQDPHQEQSEVVIGTNTLSREDWLRCCMLAWAFQCFHTLGLTQQIAVFLKAYKGISYKRFYENLLDHIACGDLQTHLGKVATEVMDGFMGIPYGRGWGIVDQRFGNIVWPPEEGAFLKLVTSWGVSYDSILPLVEQFLGDKSLARSLMNYQKSVIVKPWDAERTWSTCFQWNFTGYFAATYRGEPCDLRWTGDELSRVIQARSFKSLEEYAREQVWYNRKGGTGNFHKVEAMK